MNKVRPFDHAWSLLKAAGRAGPIGGSAESQPVGRYNPSIHSSEYDFTNIAPGRSNTNKINPREMLEEAEPPEPASPRIHGHHPIDQPGLDRRSWDDYKSGDPFGEYGEMAGPDALRDINKPSMRHKEEMMRELEQQSGGPPVSSGYDQMPIEQKVEHARGYVPTGEDFAVDYGGLAPIMGHDSRGIRGEDDSSVYGEAKRFEPDVAPLSQEIYRHR